MNPARLVLGTAQLGLAYGLANAAGKPDAGRARAIVACAWELGVREFDTAQAYGDSEAVLGRALRELGITGQARLVSKLHPDLDLADPGEVRRSVQRSLERLGCPGLHGLMLHREFHLELWDQGLGRTMAGLVDSGLAAGLGVSVYGPQWAVRALKTPGMDMVQVPSGVLDRRFERAGVFAAARGEGKAVYVRSLFLQGLVLLEPGALPPRMRFAAPWAEALGALAAELGLTRAELALGYARQAYPGAGIVFGAETPQQVEENVRLWSRGYPRDLVPLVRERFFQVDEQVVNPVLWPAGD